MKGGESQQPNRSFFNLFFLCVCVSAERALHRLHSGIPVRWLWQFYGLILKCMFLISELHIKKNSKKLYAFVCLDACSIVLQTYKTGTGLPQNHRKVFLQTNNGMLYFVVQCQCANVCCFFFLLNSAESIPRFLLTRCLWCLLLTCLRLWLVFCGS